MWSLITNDKVQKYEGPVNYITHHEVYKESNTTPVCLVSNSSFHNGNTSLNECLVKGPNTLADIFINLVKFCAYKVSFVDQNKSVRIPL